MARKQDAYYFDNFIACAEESCHAASLLRKVLGDFKPQELEKYLEEIHEIENRADGKKHEMLDRLAKEFIPPIEREDIVELSQHIDTVTDKVEDVLMRVYMGNAQEIEPDALEMTDVVIQCCEKVRELLTDFADFRRSKNLKELIIQINALEETSDRLFMRSMRKLHTECSDPLHIIVWREIYSYLERCADACEHVADTVESVVMKNS
ncbi:MAG TPA: DUF47 family protein [Candidatus Blautia merdipullorum]|nr:DUF47 family protein [Candidatus Blautia merdipullorum]